MSEHPENLAVNQFPVHGILVSELANSHQDVIGRLGRVDRRDAVALFAGLLTVPQLQTHCIRLEALVHLAVRFAEGDRPLDDGIAAEMFEEMGHGICGWQEDPPEDVFAASVTTAHGDYRHIEGYWESATFYLQRVVELLNTLPAEGGWEEIPRSTMALLRVSEEVCRRSGHGRFELPSQEEPGLSAETIADVRRRVSFREEELRELGVDIEDLDVFVFRPGLAGVLDHVGLQHSPLLYHPVLRFEDRYVLAMPTAVSVAIRQFVIGALVSVGQREAAVKILAGGYASLFRNIPPLGVGREPPIFFHHEDKGSMAEYGAQVEPGRFAHFVFMLDSLDGIVEEGLARAMPIDFFSKQAKAAIGAFRRHAEESGPVREGVTFLVMCGVGRGCIAGSLLAEDLATDGWRVVFITAPDLETLALLDRRLLTVHALLGSADLLHEHGVRLVNFSGLLNLLAMAEAQEGHLIPHDGIGASLVPPVNISVPTNALLDLRQERWLKAERRTVALPTGELVKVCRHNNSLFEDDQHYPLYVDEQWNDDYGIRLVFVGEHVTLWAECERPHSYERWMLLNTWLPRIGEAIETVEWASDVGCVLFRVQFANAQNFHTSGPKPTIKEIFDDITASIDIRSRLITVKAKEFFDHGLSLEENASESALVRRMLEGVVAVAELPGDDVVDLLHGAIVPNGAVRYAHRFHARRFRDYVQETIPSKPLRLEPIYGASLRIGLGWKYRTTNDGPEVEGKGACCSYLNDVVRGQLDELCVALRRFDRRSLISCLLLSHEAAMVLQQRWRKTSRANLGMRPDSAAVLRTIVQNEMENNAVLLSSRVLVELAICECPENGGQTPSDTDASELLSQLLIVIAYGGWSDAIHYDAMEASLTVRPLGDVHGNLDFVHQVAEPFGHTSGSSIIHDSVINYSRNYEEPDVTGAVRLNQAFLDAFYAETGLQVDDCRRVADTLEDEGIRRESAIFEASLAELKELLEPVCEHWKRMLDGFLLSPRESWRELPEGATEKDLWPWRFRRAMSLLRRPLLRINQGSEARFLVAPGIFRDAIALTLSGYYEGSFHSREMSSDKMRKWAGSIADERGKRFTQDVAELLQKDGWKTKSEVKVRTIVTGRDAERYGDVDVMAVSADGSRVVLLECKHLHFHKTLGEIAEQVQDYRGERRGKKRDDMLKHIERTDLLRKRASDLTSFLGLLGEPRVESWVVFRHPVPMLHSWQQKKAGVGVCTFDTVVETLRQDQAVKEKA